MATNRESLLATTYLAIAFGGTALAGTVTYTETTDYGNTFATATIVGPAAITPGTTIVNGMVSDEDPYDFFEVTGLSTDLGYTLYTFSVIAIGSGEAMAAVSRTDGFPILFPTLFDSGGAITFGSAAPGNGDLVIEIEHAGGSSHLLFGNREHHRHESRACHDHDRGRGFGRRPRLLAEAHGRD